GEYRLGQLLTLPQACRQFQAAHRSLLAGFLPAGTGPVATHPAFHWHDFRLLYQHAPAFPDPRPDPEGPPPHNQPRRDQVVGNLQIIQPEQRHGRENPPLVRDTRGQDPVKGTDAVRGDNDQAIPQVIDVADLAMAARVTFDVAFQEWLHILSFLA